MRAQAGLSLQQRLARGIAATSFAGSVINCLDRAVLGVVMPQIRSDLHLGNQEYGWAVDTSLASVLSHVRVFPAMFLTRLVAGIVYGVVRAFS